MPKRFTATEKWEKVWFRKLKPIYKCFWIYVLDRCNHAGIWEVDFELAEIFIGETLDIKELQTIFQKQYIQVNNNKWFIKDFVDFQYGELNPGNRAHFSVINILKKEGAYKGFTRGLQGRKDMDKDKDKVKDKDKEIMDYFNEVCEKSFKLNDNRLKIIQTRLKEYTVDQIKKAILNFSKDDWEDRGKYCDIVYAIGIRDKIDNLEKWLNYVKKSSDKGKYVTHLKTIN